MLETLMSRKEALQAQGKKGFTLMEMLIVIAIIAVLIAIAIPIFSSQLTAADKAVDEANIRSGYAQVQTEIMLNKAAGPFYLKADGTVVSDAATADYTAKSDIAAGDNVMIGGVKATTTKGSKIQYTITDGAIASIGPVS